MPGDRDDAKYSEAERHFLRHARKGVTLSAQQLAAYCVRRRLPYSMDKLRHLRRRWKFTAIYSRKTKVPHYMSMAIARYGVVQCDLAHWGKYGDTKRESRTERDRRTTDRRRLSPLQITSSARSSA
jgi:hypothetical protein